MPWITPFIKKMKSQQRHVLLLLDNAPFHPQGLELSNVKIHFPPTNTTSVLQPLDLGIIKNIKCHYRTRLLRAVLAKVESSDSASEISKSVNVLQAAHWISQAVKAVKPETVQNCFAKPGVITEKDNEFTDEDDIPLAQLLADVLVQVRIDQPMSADSYKDIDNDIPATEELPVSWERQLAADIRLECALSKDRPMPSDVEQRRLWHEAMYIILSFYDRGRNICFL